MLCRSATDGYKQPRTPHRKPSTDTFHIRKPSLSNSVSSASSTSTARTAHSSRNHSHSHPHADTIDFDPLGLHPTFIAPPRLSDRPFIFPQRDHAEMYPGVAEEAVYEEYLRGDDAGKELQPPQLDQVPSSASDSPTPVQHTGHERQPPSREDEGGDYFLYKLRLLERESTRLQQQDDQDLPTRADLPRSRWSESTIQTIDTDDLDDGPEIEVRGGDYDNDDEAEDDDRSVFEMVIPAERRARQTRQAVSWQNFSYKRPMTAPAPRRPPMRTMDSIDDFIKRGGWKRRGIVFHKDDDASEDDVAVIDDEEDNMF